MSLDSHIFILVSYNLLISLYIFMLKMSQIWPVGTIEVWSLFHCDIYPLIFEYSLPSGTIRFPKLIGIGLFLTYS